MPPVTRPDLAGRMARKERRADRTASNEAIRAALIGQVVQKGDLKADSRAASAPPVDLKPKRASWPTRTPVRAKAGKPKKPKSPSLSKLKNLLWAEVSQLVRSWSPLCVACGGFRQTEVAAHIVPANDGAATRFFLPNLYPCCMPCNTAERFQRGSWVYKHREMFGDDFVDALYAFSKTTHQIKKWWVLEQTDRMRRLRGVE